MLFRPRSFLATPSLLSFQGNSFTARSLSLSFSPCHEPQGLTPVAPGAVIKNKALIMLPNEQMYNKVVVVTVA